MYAWRNACIAFEVVDSGFATAVCFIVKTTDAQAIFDAFEPTILRIMKVRYACHTHEFARACTVHGRKRKFEIFGRQYDII